MSQSKWPWGQYGDHRRGEIELDSNAVDNDARWGFRNKFVRLRDDPVVFPDGTQGWHVSIHPPLDVRIVGVVMLPVWNGKFILCRNYRHAPRRWFVEAPRGSIDFGESPLDAAHRELMEEYGVGGEMTDLGCCNPDSGLLAADVQFFWCALEAMPTQVGDVAKQAPLQWSFSNLLEAIRTGVVQDSFLCVATMLGLSKGLISPLPRDLAGEG